MGTRQALLALLEAQRGTVFSGEELAARLNVSRAAVWKAMEALRREGHSIEATPGAGYMLSPGSDTLSAEGIKAHMPKGGPPVQVLAEVDSTNTAAKRWALEGAPHGALVVAGRQKGGKGRRGRSFDSPPGGLYMSVVLRPHIDATDAVLVTSAAAVAVCRAVQALCGIDLQIKWVNDLFFGTRKCCGILSEAGTGFEDGGLEYIVVGIGINYTTRQSAFAPELRDIVTSLYPQGGAPLPRAQLIAAIQGELMALFAALPDTAFLQEYRARSLVLGRQVQVQAPQPYTALAVDIDERARLVVRTSNGEEQRLASGEISVKLQTGEEQNGNK